jgi:hypothetical protein
MSGHFIEHLGGVIYDGVWVGEKSKIPNEGGIRLGLVDALKAIRAPIIRWPGGCFADSYDWRDGIGSPSAQTANQFLGRYGSQFLRNPGIPAALRIDGRYTISCCEPAQRARAGLLSVGGILKFAARKP